MALEISDNDIWFWYCAIKEQKESEISANTYCKLKTLDYKKFTNLRYRIFYTEHLRPDEYQMLIKIGRESINSPMRAGLFAKIHNISKAKLSEVKTHILYKDAIDRLKIERNTLESQEMSFIKVAPAQKVIIPAPQYSFPVPVPAEIMEAQNDIELVITKGVKVMISPQVDSMKIIKIIELLKDL